MPSERGPEQPGKQTSPLRAVAAVLSAFIGIRKNAARDRDQDAIRPLHVVIAGVIAAAVFVLTIVTVVRLIT
ncbi:MAG: DUF2970 domain-containing protein [Burkholderiales bacterium]|nr:DUF2970 domain-containing protein [Burkholderiales bacterium]